MPGDQTDPRAERRIVESTAAALRSRIAQDVYVGARHWRDLDDDLRDEVVQHCRAIVAAST
jgi:hypothetical protein